MPYIISSNKPLLDAINQKINNYMKANIKNYSAIIWGDVTKHPTKDEWALKLNDDERKPLDRLTNSEKLQLIDELPEGWVVDEKSS